ncbi:type II toxin-antitoxin system HipA family toxin [Chitinophaga sancti]|uniref:Serine/threonine-protein kinase HipA n=1 Tax=Chitinophaga sancti TaxID=1004 RepID=A0A1K1T3Z9_9BACT|nr:type II toxin-antitoxin system HipA family toxin [Chitinophaga sancti]WQD59903.1 type II toxin-antitoxin system HipA family toxin [Chitinophaga sancti]WQG87967.1 type II toxin-antitoxin system HipA family toxin [Chitinophaga sancti]SFW91238.1 serine/threonine-protein kinase HipA [Chitinophaga sancti]
MAKTDIWVYAHWKGMAQPKLIGSLSADLGKTGQQFSFKYHKDWLESAEQLLLDPEIGWYTGTQYPIEKENFGVFVDSMPDTWGRRLMQRKAAQSVREKNEHRPRLTDLDYLLQVSDFTRMGALRFKLHPDGPFLNNDNEKPIPPWAHIRELQQSAEKFETDEEVSNEWLELLIAPGSSLGGARPKANIIDEKGQLWIAKFPAKNDTIDKAAWEYLTYRLAVKSGIKMSDCKVEQIYGPYKTFLTKRFDREGADRIHFTSAMTMLGYTEQLLRDKTSSYLEIAEFIQYQGAAPMEDLHQLWRRIVFNMSVSNTDDHLRNHGFILTDAGWRLSPAYDLNPSIDKNGLALNVDLDDNTLNYKLAFQVGDYFQLGQTEMTRILTEVTSVVSNWEQDAKGIGIPRSQIQQMVPAFSTELM